MDVERMRAKGAQTTEKAKRLLDQMSLEEKVALMSGDYGMLQLMFDTVILHHYNRVPAVAGGTGG